MSLDRVLTQHRSDIDDYLGTVRALYAFAISACWDESARSMRSGARWSIPRRMDVIPEEEDAPRKTITPDAVVQISDAYGVVAEAKKNFSSHDEAEVLEQLSRYDQDLYGWWTATEKMDRHDLALLTHMSTSVYAREAYERWIEDEEFERPLAVVEFAYHEMSRVWLMLRKVAGAVSDPEHDEALRRGKNIDGGLLLKLFDKWKFLDQKPPVIHTMLLIHDYVLPTMVAEREFDPRSGARVPVAEATVDQIRGALARQFCEPTDDPRSFKLPKRSWVTEAVEEFRKAGLAAPLLDDRYRFPLKKPLKKDTLEYLTYQMARGLGEQKSQPDEHQVSLFEGIENDDEFTTESE